ncbi:hypothetical protein [Sphingomonas sp. dw_22]|uniref:hypothetical protein n=1 Tax=Sphingomonas sp. dw_22 TaxID=2721175 RepID=UPI001BD22C3B|nr:hypothetical protein [Sphingomonas sp. dw_22]
MAGTSDIYTSYLTQKGPLTQEESTLKDLLLRQQIFRFQPQSFQSATASPAPSATANPSNVATPPIVAENDPEFEGSMLPYVNPGDLITAGYMNTVVDAVNGIIDYLQRTSGSGSNIPIYSLGTLLSATSPVAGIIKDAVADTGSDDVVTVNIPGTSINPGDFEALVYGKRRIDPGDLVKTDSGVSFKINKADIGTDSPDLLAVAKGAANQQLLQLFR